MSKWDDFCSTVGKYAGRAAKKTEELADSASIHIKMKGLDVKLCEEYEKLGRLAYKKLKKPEFDGTEEIATVMAAINARYAEKKELQAKLDELRARAKCEKEAEAAPSEAVETDFEEVVDTPAETDSEA